MRVWTVHTACQSVHVIEPNSLKYSFDDVLNVNILLKVIKIDSRYEIVMFSLLCRQSFIKVLVFLCIILG